MKKIKNLSGVAEFVRTLGLIGPLVGLPGVTAIANTAASLLEAGVNGLAKLDALTAEMKARHEAGVTTTAAEILAVIDRIKENDKKIQATAPGSG